MSILAAHVYILVYDNRAPGVHESFNLSNRVLPGRIPVPGSWHLLRESFCGRIGRREQYQLLSGSIVVFGLFNHGSSGAGLPVETTAA